MYTRLVALSFILASLCAITGSPLANPGDAHDATPFVKCGTPDALRAYMAMKVAGISAIDLDQSRLGTVYGINNIPESLTSHVSPSGRFKVHYAAEGYHSPEVVDADMNGVPDYVDSTAAYLDYAWELEIETLGYPVPKSDSGIGGGDEVDAYLKEFGSGGYGFTYPEQTAGGSSAAYMIIDNDYSESQYEANGYAALQVTTAHEFFHVVQFSMLTDIGLMWWMEQSAVWMEDRAWDDVNDYTAYLYLFFSDNTTSLDSNIGSFMYGAGIWPSYLARRHGEDIIRDTWLHMAQSGIHHVGAMDEIIPGGIAEAFHEFAVWNYFTGDRSNPLDFHHDADLFDIEVKIDTVAKVSPGGDAFSTNHLTSRYVDIRFLGDWGADDAVDVTITTDPLEDFLGSFILYNSPSDYRIVPLDGGTGHISLGRTWTGATLVISCTETTGTLYDVSYAAEVSPGTFVAVDTPGAFTLDAPYPNPFNPQTTIAFSLAEPEHTTVRIYNSAGQHVTTLLDERLSAGAKRLMWKPAELAAGQYILTVDTPAGRRSAKLLYCK